VSADELVGLLADDQRLRVAAAVVLAPAVARDVAATANVPLRKTLEALSRLEAAGLARRDHVGRWCFVADELHAAARAVRPAREPDDLSDSDARSAVLRAFFADDRLKQIPAMRTKRLVVLDRLAGEFEPGRRYTEAEVNATLRRRHDDVAALRRYLVDEGFLSRDRSIYWRTGGTVDI
jgi:hypothetical protein